MAAAAGLVVQPPFDSSYQIPQANHVGPSGPNSVPGIPCCYSALGFPPGDTGTLLMAGASYDDDGTGANGIYAISVIRDANGHITALANSSVKLYNAPGLPGTARGVGPALSYGPGGNLFYTSIRDNSLGMIKRGSLTADKHIDLSTLAPTAIIQASALTFVPKGIPGAGRLKIASFAGEFYDVTLSADGSGTYNVSAVHDVGKLADTGPDGGGQTNSATGLTYVEPGNPQFGTARLLVSVCDYNGGTNSNLVAYPLDSNGDPIIASAQTVATGLCSTGATVDPLTGDLLFSSFYGFPNLYVFSGFTVPPPGAKASAGPAFGNVAVGSTSIIRTVTLANRQKAPVSADPVNVGTPAVSGPGFSIASTTCGGILPGGEACTVSLQFTPTGVGTSSGTLNLPLIGSPDSGSPFQLPLNGNGTTQTTASPASLSFLNLAVGSTSAPQNVYLSNHGSSPVSIGAITVSSGFNISANSCAGSLPGLNSACAVSVTFTPTVVGATSGTLSISDSPDGLSPHLISLGGNATDEVTVSPANLAFGGVTVGQSAVQTVYLSNHTSGPVTVNTPTINGPGFSISATTCGGALAGSNTACSVTVMFTPTSTSGAKGTLTITDSPDSQPSHAVSLGGFGK